MLYTVSENLFTSLFFLLPDPPPTKTLFVNSYLEFFFFSIFSWWTIQTTLWEVKTWEQYTDWWADLVGWNLHLYYTGMGGWQGARWGTNRAKYHFNNSKRLCHFSFGVDHFKLHVFVYLSIILTRLLVPWGQELGLIHHTIHITEHNACHVADRWLCLLSNDWMGEWMNFMDRWLKTLWHYSSASFPRDHSILSIGPIFQWELSCYFQ